MGRRQGKKGLGQIERIFIMRFRITYTNNYKESKTMIVIEDSYFHAERLAKNMFGDYFISCEDMDLQPEKYIADFDNGEYT